MTSTVAQGVAFATTRGTAASAYEEAFNLIDTYGGFTAWEIEQRTGMDRLTICASLSNLRSDGLIKDSGEQREGGRGKQITVWVTGDDSYKLEALRIRRLAKYTTEQLQAEIDRRSAT